MKELRRAEVLADGALTLSGAPFQENLGQSFIAVASSLDYNSTADRAEDFQVGLFPVRSPLLRESWLVSFPPLNDMLKFGG